MRQRGATSITTSIMTRFRRVSLLALTGWLVLALLPLAALAAPPSPDEPAIASDSSTKAGSDNKTPPETARTSLGEKSSHDRPSASGFVAGWGSVRRRGFEAPMQLRLPEPKPAAPEVDKGDGVPPRAADKPAKKPDEKPKQDETPRQNLRVWPMRARSYTFTQPFGCVPQIANFYFAGEGCPPDAPVVHSGVDLAAPEGTPFYAAAAGWVTDSGYDREVGVPNTRIIIQHVGRNEQYSTVYLHWVASYVEVGDYVEAGDMIGEVGNVGYSTGPHLHFEVVDLDSGEHIDPIGWLPKTPGNEGYRGVQPNAKASMRLPAGTTAGLPEMSDPSPPPPPERQDVPDSPRQGKGNGKHKRDRQDERAARHDDAPSVTSDETTTESRGRDGAADTTSDTEKAKGKRKNRAHNRERNKDGQSREDAASGDNGDASNADEGSDNSRSHDKSKRDNHGGRRGNGNGNGNDSGKHGNSQRDKNNKSDQGGNGGKNDKNSGNKNDADESDDNSPDTGRGSGENPGSRHRDQTAANGDESTGNGGAEGQQPIDEGASETNDGAPAVDNGDKQARDDSESSSDTQPAQAADDGGSTNPPEKTRRQKASDAGANDS